MVLAAVGRQIGWIRTVVTNVTQRDAPGREAGAELLVARALVLIIADVDEGELLEPDIGPGELFLSLALFRCVLPSEGGLGPSREKHVPRVF